MPLGMTERPSPPRTAAATLRAKCALQAQRTLERLTEGIAALTRAGAPITAKTIEAQPD